MKVIISEQTISIRKGSFGISLDDVNYAFDGGLYAELIENRNFEAKEVALEGGAYCVAAGGGYGWSPVGASALKVKTDRPLHAENPHYLRVETSEAGAGAENSCYGGAALAKGGEYRLCFSVRSFDCKGKATVGVYDGSSPLFEKEVKLRADGKWHRYSLRVKSRADGTGKFRFLLGRAGIVHVDCFSLMPAYAVLGCFRHDLVGFMSDLKPAFLRFAGNCGVGAARASWKDSVGDIELRRHNWNVWAAHSPAFSHYGKTQGIGILECLRLAEYLNAKPIPVLDMGTPSDPDVVFEALVQDALDFMDFATGTGLWGKLRAERGHPAPFKVDTLEVGYMPGIPPKAASERFLRFSARIRAVYPDVRLVPPQRPLFLRPAALYHNVTLYDGLPRENAVTLTEYSARSGETADPAANAWEGALAEAAFLTGAERNGDVVALKSYAPFFARCGCVQWSPALVWFDSCRAYGSASYYVQKLYGQYTGEYAMAAKTEEPLTYATASEGDGYTFVKLVNASEREIGAEITGRPLGSLTRIIQMSGDPSDCNTAEEPLRIVPHDVAPVAPRYALLPPHSFTVLVFRK